MIANLPWYAAAALVFAVIIPAARWEQKHRPEAASFATPICHCGCCRKCTEHNEMKAAA